jgi:hypothetical protein
MKSIAWITLYSAVLLGLASCGKDGKGPLATIQEKVYETKIMGWPEESNSVAKLMIDKYGAPNESTDSMLIWYNNGNWKKTVVYRDPVDHHFPKPHQDVLKQTIDFKVPVEKASDLLSFYGSLIIDRTKGELSARSDREEMNLLALNLAFDIMSNKKGVEAARKEYAKTASALSKGKSSDYVESLKFQIPKDTTDPDEVYTKKPKAKPSSVAPSEIPKLNPRDSRAESPVAAPGLKPPRPKEPSPDRPELK